MIQIDAGSRTVCATEVAPDRTAIEEVSPAVAGDLLLVGSCNGMLRAIDRTTGLEIWSYEVLNDGANNFHGELIVFEDSVLFATDGTFDGWIYRVGLKTGIPIWKVYAERGVPAGLILAERRLYALALGEGFGLAMCLDAVGGETIWTTSIPFAEEASLTMGRLPALTDSALVCAGADGFLVAFDRETGDEVWTLELESESRIGVVVLGDALCTGTEEGRLLRVNPVTRVILDGAQLGGRLHGPYVFDDRNRLLAFSEWMATGSELHCYGKEFEPLWSVASPDTSSWTTARAYPWLDGFVAGTDSGEFWLLDQDSGSLVPLYRIEGVARSFSWFDGVAYFGTIDGTLVAVEAIE
jgi:outer membrane protein assembly factor BamB